MTKPIALVIGATGAQGGSVAAALEGKYQIRTLTRDPTKPAAQALAAKGYEVLKGEIGDIDVVKAALKDAEVVFLVTQFWENFNKAKEATEGKAFVDAVAATPSVKKFVVSTLENVTRVTGGKITKVAHFDGKGEIEDYIMEKGINAVCVRMAAYIENWLGFFTPRPAGDDAYVIVLPDMGSIPYNCVSVADTGKFVAPILEDYDSYRGKAVALVSELRPLGAIIEDLAAVTGKKVSYSPVSVEVFAGFGFPGAEDIAAMFQFYRDGPCDRDPATALKLYPGALKTKEWAEQNKEKLMGVWFPAPKAE